MTTTLVLEPPCAFINANDRLHYAPKAKLTKAWRDAATEGVDHYWNQNGTPNGRLTRAHITVSIRFPTNRRRDVGNLYPTAKAIVDGLVDAQLLADDDDTRVVGPDMRREYPNGPARVTVTITPLEQP